MRTPLDKLRRLFLTIGIAVSLGFMLAGALALGLGYSTHHQVAQQLSQEHITFPATGTDELNALPAADKAAVSQYAGQALTTGPQAKVYADNFIWVHMQEATKGKAYAQMDRQDPARATALTGDTLRGMLLSAFAWYTVGSYAIIGGYGLLALGVVMLAVIYFANRRAPRPALAAEPALAF